MSPPPSNSVSRIRSLTATPPLLGERSVELMHELGYSDDVIAAWAAEGVVRTR